MTRRYEVLILSSSTINFTESDPALTLVALVEQSLKEKHAAADWHCRGGLLYITPTMASRALKLAEGAKPDFVILRPTGLAFLHDDVTSRIRDRWPAIYPLCLRISELFRGLAGGKRYGAEGARGWLFRLPRMLAVKLIGEAPRVPVEAAVEYTRETIDALLRLEDTDSVCYLSVGNSHSHMNPVEYARRANYFNENIQAHCASRRIPCFRNNQALIETGIGYQYGQDQWHATVPFRRLEASLMADEVLNALAATSTAGH